MKKSTFAPKFVFLLGAATFMATSLVAQGAYSAEAKKAPAKKAATKEVAKTEAVSTTEEVPSVAKESTNPITAVGQGVASGVGAVASGIGAGIGAVGRGIDYSIRSAGGLKDNYIDEKFAITPNISTLGLGVQAEYLLADKFVLRGGPSYMSFSTNRNIASVKYDVDLDLKNIGAIIDWHPVENGWKVSAGAFFGDNTLDLKATPKPATPIEIGNGSYTGTQVGTLQGDVETNKLLPYIGTGYSNTFYNDGHWHFMADIGLVLVGSPDAKLTSSGGTQSNSPTLQADLRREENKIEDVSFIKAYPVFGMGLTYKF